MVTFIWPFLKLYALSRVRAFDVSVIRIVAEQTSVSITEALLTVTVVFALDVATSHEVYDESIATDIVAPRGIGMFVLMTFRAVAYPDIPPK